MITIAKYVRPTFSPSANAGTGTTLRRLAFTSSALLIIFLGLFVPSLLKSPHYLGLLISAVELGIAALALGFLAHQCGLVMLGIAGIAGGSTYLFAIAVRQFGLQTMPAAAFALFGATALAALVGSLIVRARPLPFAMLTLALAQMLKSAVTITDLRPLTGGDDGLTIRLSGDFFGISAERLAEPAALWPIAWLALCGAMALSWSVGRSRLGIVLRAIRANEERMRFSGFNTYLPRLIAFTLASFIGALGGLLTGLHSAFASPELLDLGTSGNALVSMLMGGAATVTGPALGALLFVFGQDQFGASGYIELLTGICMVIVIAAFPEGAMGGFYKFFRSRASKRSSDDGSAGAAHVAR